MGTEVAAVEAALTTRVVSAGGEVIAAHHTAEIAEYSRDALAKVTGIAPFVHPFKLLLIAK